MVRRSQRPRVFMHQPRAGSSGGDYLSSTRRSACCGHLPRRLVLANHPDQESCAPVETSQRLSWEIAGVCPWWAHDTSVASGDVVEIRPGSGHSRPATSPNRKGGLSGVSLQTPQARAGRHVESVPDVVDQILRRRSSGAGIEGNDQGDRGTAHAEGSRGQCRARDAGQSEGESDYVRGGGGELADGLSREWETQHRRGRTPHPFAPGAGLP